MKNYYRVNGKIVGSIEEDGTCRDINGRISCYLLADGTIVEDKTWKRILYRIHTDGTITKGTSNSICGYINTDGNVTETRSSTFNTIKGKFDYNPNYKKTNSQPNEISSAPSRQTSSYSEESYNTKSYFAPEWVHSFNVFMIMALIFGGLGTLPFGIIFIILGIAELFIPNKLFPLMGYSDKKLQWTFFIFNVSLSMIILSYLAH